MIDNETIESFLITMGLSVEQLRDGMWRVHDDNENTPPVIISYEAPIVYVRLKVMDLPETGREALYSRLLALNANGIAFGAYAVEDNQVVLLDTMHAESMEIKELQASIESVLLAAGEHYRELLGLVRGVE